MECDTQAQPDLSGDVDLSTGRSFLVVSVPGVRFGWREAVLPPAAAATLWLLPVAFGHWVPQKRASGALMRAYLCPRASRTCVHVLAHSQHVCEHPAKVSIFPRLCP